jgi:hypothetical protein
MAYSIIQKFKNSNVLEIETAEGVKQRSVKQRSVHTFTHPCVLNNQFLPNLAT